MWRLTPERLSIRLERSIVVAPRGMSCENISESEAWVEFAPELTRSLPPGEPFRASNIL
jgi:hypothetical protein